MKRKFDGIDSAKYEAELLLRDLDHGILLMTYNSELTDCKKEELYEQFLSDQEKLKKYIFTLHHAAEVYRAQYEQLKKEES